jgi:hypothetical protein
VVPERGWRRRTLAAAEDDRCEQQPVFVEEALAGEPRAQVAAAEGYRRPRGMSLKSAAFAGWVVTLAAVALEADDHYPAVPGCGERAALLLPRRQASLSSVKRARVLG